MNHEITISIHIPDELEELVRFVRQNGTVAAREPREIPTPPEPVTEVNPTAEPSDRGADLPASPVVIPVSAEAAEAAGELADAIAEACEVTLNDVVALTGKLLNTEGVKRDDVRFVINKIGDSKRVTEIAEDKLGSVYTALKNLEPE